MRDARVGRGAIVLAPGSWRPSRETKTSPRRDVARDHLSRDRQERAAIRLGDMRANRPKRCEPGVKKNASSQTWGCHDFRERISSHDAASDVGSEEHATVAHADHRRHIARAAAAFNTVGLAFRSCFPDFRSWKSARSAITSSAKDRHYLLQSRVIPPSTETERK